MGLFALPRGSSQRVDNSIILSVLFALLFVISYLNQLIYATSEIRVVITNIIENDPNAIIILQGDTGTSTGIYNPGEKATMNEIYQTHSILYAVRIQDGNNFENFISVNTYRMIFNNYFDMNYEYLEQRVYVSNEDNTWKDITKTISEYKFG